MRKYDIYGGLIICSAIAMGIAETVVKGPAQTVVLDFAPYVMWAVIGLVVASIGEDINDD